MDKVYGEAIYRVLIQLIREERLSSFSDEDYKLTITKHHIKFDELVKSNYTPIRATQGRQKGNITGYRRANKPRRSPLMTGGEMDFITEFITPAWSSLDNLKQDYLDDVLNSTSHFDVINVTVRDIFNKRWQILAKFAKLTKKRLEAIRKIDPKFAQLRKAGVTTDHVSTLIMRRNSPGTQFLSELRILGGFFYDELVKTYCLKHNITKSSWESYVNKTILMSYQKDISLDIKNLDMIPDKESLSKIEEEYINDQRVIRAFFQTSNSLLTKAKQFEDINKEYATKIGDKLIELSIGILKIPIEKTNDFNFDEIAKYNLIEGIRSRQILSNIKINIDKELSSDEIQNFINRKSNTPTNVEWVSMSAGLRKLKGRVIHDLKPAVFLNV